MGHVTSTQDHTLVGHNHMQCTQWWRDGEGINECQAWALVWVPAGTITRSTSRTFDGLGRLWTIGGNNGQNVQTGYDADDNPITITDSLKHATTLSYDAFDRVVKSVDANGGVTQFAYDAGDNVMSVTDPKGLVTTYVHDGFGQLWAQSSPDTGTTSFTYSAGGLRTGMTRADGSVTTYAYDALGRLTGATAGGQTQTFVYDTCTHGAGRLCSVTDAQGSLTNTYTPEGWLASQTSTVAGTAYTTRYVYDALGRTTSITYPNGVVANTTYANGKPATMTATVNGVTGNVVTGLTYQPYGSASGWTYGNGLVRGNDFDLDGRLTGIGTTTPSNAAVIQSLTYGYDANDSITAVTNGVTSALSQSFGYDELTRLTSVSSASGNAAWTFDGNGNRMNQTTATSSVAYAIAASSNRMVGADARSFGFDALGNITADSGNGIAYHFDAFNRMDSSTRAGVTTTYHVDPLGRRTSKATAGGSWTNFVYAPDGTLQAENGPAGATDYLWLGGNLVGMVRNGAIYAIHTDHLGRPELVTDPNRNIVWRASNFAYDRTVTQDNIGGLNVGFPGQYYDTETGLWNNGFRDYDASVGRYIESDPLGLAAGVNTYAYVGGNPIMDVDPLGLKCDCNQAKSTGGRNNIGQPASGLNINDWSLAQELTAGNSATVDSSGGIAIQAGGIASPLPTDQFGYFVTQRPLTQSGGYESVAAPMNWGKPLYYSSGFVGGGGTNTMIFSAMSGAGGNRWFVNFPSQESTHGNAGNEYLDIYVPRCK